MSKFQKEKDIELTARIGKELLAHNQKLEANVASLESELRTANEKITQLTHELVKKTELIQILTNDVESEGGSEPGKKKYYSVILHLRHTFTSILFLSYLKSKKRVLILYLLKKHLFGTFPGNTFQEFIFI